MQHVMLRATWYEGTAQLLSLTELKSHLFVLYFVGWIIKPMKEGRKPEYPEKTPGDELQKMPHTTARRFKSKARLEPVQQHWWQARKADMLTVTPRVAPDWLPVPLVLPYPADVDFGLNFDVCVLLRFQGTLVKCLSWRKSEREWLRWKRPTLTSCLVRLLNNEDGDGDDDDNNVYL